MKRLGPTCCIALRRIVTQTAVCCLMTAVAVQTSSAQASSGASSRAPSSHGDSRGKHLPLDTAVTTGTLPNGLRYYLRVNHVPAHRAELRLVVDAGSVLEDDDQRGIAHFLEHMAFNGTTRFGKQGIVHYLESMGMRFGADLNATTGYDETIYRLTVPTDRPDAVRTGISILADWAHGITLDSAAVDAERGVILGEMRAQASASTPVQERFAALLFNGSPYAQRVPLGMPKVIERAPRSALARFYHDWYRPDRMAVVIVGDFDKTIVEQQLRAELGAIPHAGPAREAPSRTIPWHHEAVAAVMAEPNISGASIAVSFRRLPATRDTTVSMHEQVVSRLRGQLVDRLVAGMLSERLDGLGRGKVAIEEPVRGAHMYTLRTSVPSSEVRTSLTALLATVEQARQHGFTADELKRASSWYLNV